MKKANLPFLLALIFLLPCLYLTPAKANDNKSKLAPYYDETLYYKLSYQGLLTSMFWADIADLQVSFKRAENPEIDNSHYQFEFNLTTENYSKAELLYPLRYHYKALTDKTLQQVFLIEKKATGASDSHQFIWLDWHNHKIRFYKKRQKKLLKGDFPWQQDREVWEKDGAEGIPDFLNSFSPPDKKISYLIHKKTTSIENTPEILEPVSLIYLLRTLNTNSVHKNELIVKENIRSYRFLRMGLEELEVNNKKHPAIRYKVEKQGKEDHLYYMWLSNDQQKLPLLFSADAPFGRLEITLEKLAIQIK